VAEFRRTLSDELAKSEQKANGLAQDLIKAEQKTRLQQLTAPVDGVVQQLAIHTVGGVVTPAQSLLVIVPSDSRLEIEAMVSNRDIGFVQPGQQAEIKIDTFNFTRYGLLQGQVLSVSQDAIVRDRQQDRSSDRNLGTQNDTSEPKGQELNYSARISLDRSTMRIDGRTVNLSPGIGNQDRIPPHPELSIVAAHALPAGDPAGTLSSLITNHHLDHMLAAERGRPHPSQ
jgi:hemolysin D